MLTLVEIRQVYEEEEVYHVWHWVWILTVCIAGIALSLIRFPETWVDVSAPEYKQIEVDLNARRVREVRDTQVSMGVTAGTAVTISLEEEQARLYFVNPLESEQAAVITLKVGDKAVGQSGRLLPGYKLELLEGLDVANLMPGVSDGCLVVDNYDPKTGERQMLNCEVEVTVTIKD